MGTNFRKLPGSHKMRNRARNLLKCHETSKGNWIVWGGDNQHTIKQDENTFECDCNIYLEKNICSHVIKVKMSIGEFQERKQYPSQEVNHGI